MRKATIVIFIVLLAPLISRGQDYLRVAVSNIDSIKGGVAVELMIASASKAQAMTEVRINGKNGETVFTAIQVVSLVKGFNNFRIQVADSLVQDDAVSAFYTAARDLPPGQYSITVEITWLNQLAKPLQAKTNYLVKPKDAALELLYSKGRTFTDSTSLRVNTDGKATGLKGIEYHLHLAEVRSRTDIEQPFSRLRNYRWVPGLNQPDISSDEISKYLKPNRNYVCMMEAYYNGVLISKSGRQSFNTFQNKFSFRKLLYRKELQEDIIQDTSTFQKVINQLTQEQPLLPDTPVQPVRLGGTIRSEFLLSDRYQPYADIKPSFARTTITPVIYIYDIPVNGQIFLTTDHNKEYKLNSFSFNIDAAEMRRKSLEAYLKKTASQKLSDELYALKDSLKGQIAALETMIPYTSGWQLGNPATPEGLEMPDTSGVKSSLRDSLSALSSIIDDSGRNEIKDYKQTFSDSLQDIASERQTGITDNLPADSIQAEMDTLATQAEVKKRKADSLHAKLEYLQKLLSTTEHKIRQAEGTLAGLKQHNLYGIKNSYKDLISKNGDVVSKLISVVDDVEIGLFYPIFSPLSLNGTGVNGAGITLSTQKLYFRALGGSSPALGRLTSLEDTNSRNYVYGVKTGLGKPTSNHIYISLVNAGVNQQGKVDLNSILSTELGLRVAKRLSVTGEISKSLISSEMNNPAYGVKPLALNEASTLRNAVALTSRTSYEDASRKTFISSELRRIPLSYQTFMVPFLRPDGLQHTVNFRRKLLKNALTFMFDYRRIKDNLSGYRSYSSDYKGYMLRLSFQKKNLPHVSVLYSYNQQEQSILKFKGASYHLTSSVISLNASHSYRIGRKWIALTSAVLSHTATSGTGNYLNRSGTLLQQVRISDKALFSFSANYCESLISGISTSFWNTSGDVNLKVNQKWSCGAGMNTSSSIDHSVRMNPYCLVNFQSQRFQAQLRAGRNYLNNVFLEGNRIENVVSGICTYLF